MNNWLFSRLRNGSLNALSLKLALLSAVISLLSACSGGSGADTEENNPPPGGGSSSNYSGPPPATADIQKFYVNFWTPMVERCGGCHTDGGQSPQFVRDDDVNLAYTDAVTIANFADPVKSRAVEKVGSGHNCWLTSNTACADFVTQAITRWAGSGTGTANEVTFVPVPNLTTPGNSRGFSESPEDFDRFVWTPYLIGEAGCNRCHTANSPTAQQPYFASNDLATAYAAAKSRINLDTPSRSRLVIRLRDESHNCWSDCMANANEMQAAIQALADATEPVQMDPSLIPSRAMRMLDGIIASSGGRFEQNLIGLWQFKEGIGSVAYDTSAVVPATDMELYGNVSWVGGWGLQFKVEQGVPGRNFAKAQAKAAGSKKLHDMIRASGEYTIETWAAPANVVQDNSSRLISYSAGSNAVNFALGQSLYNYDFLMRMSTTDASGMAAHSTANDDQRAQATLQHVVVTFDPTNGRRIYVNGEFTGDDDDTDVGNLADWDDAFALIFGNEADGMHQWEGTLKMVAIHNRALTEEQIAQNFKAGVGERYYLLFSVAHLVPESKGCMQNGQSLCYIVVEVSQYDSYGYLFNAPFLAALNDTIDLSDVPVKGMRIGLNAREVPVGQVFAKMNTSLGRHKNPLSTLGTVVTVEAGPANDQFFLTFEQLGTNTHVVLEPSPPPVPAPIDLEPASHIGVRTFDEINASMAVITGISRNDTDVKTTFDNIKRSLPATDALASYASSHQMAVTQLAIKYCDKLIRDTSKRSEFFPGFNFAANASTAFNGSGTDQIIDPLMSKITGNNLSSQPSDTDVRTELNLLINGGSQTIDGRLVNYPGLKNSSSTESVVKATCAAALGSAAMLVQ